MALSPLGYNMKRMELLSPAGTLKSMRYAFAYGADAVYAGLPRYSLRARNNEFNLSNIKTGINEAQALRKKFFVVSNIYPHNSKVKTFIKDISPIIALQPDAFIMSDPGLIMMVKDQWPDTEIHLSVQSNVVNYASVKFWQRMGITRIILSRELSLEQIEEIRQLCPDIELEVFVHGALCMAYSGRCMLSGYINHRDANQGVCTNACRWKYTSQSAKSDEWGNINTETEQKDCCSAKAGVDDMILLQETGRPNKPSISMQEDEHGTYLLNSKDLRAIHHVEKLVKIGIDCIKIEGRTKSHFYVARTAQLYRQAIDDAQAGRPFNIDLMDKLEGLSSRGYTEGLLRRHVFDEYQNYETGNSTSDKQKFVAEVIECHDDKGFVTVDVKNHFEVGDKLELMSPTGNAIWTLDAMQDKDNREIHTARGSGMTVKIQLPDNIKGEKGLIMRFIDLPISNQQAIT